MSRRRTFFHRTTEDAARAILRHGFRDTTGAYMLSTTVTGVWISDVPLDVNEGASGNTLLAVKLPEARVRQYEVIEEGKPYREWVVPASLLNRRARLRRFSEAEEERLERRGRRKHARQVQAMLRALAGGVPIEELRRAGER